MKYLKEKYLQILWGRVLALYQKTNPKIVAITGAVGKTGTKEAIALVLAASKEGVLKTKGNLNTETGVPLSILGVDEVPTGLWQWLKVVLFVKPKAVLEKIWVLEYSTDKPGDITYLTNKIRPNIAVMSRIVPAHTQFFSQFSDYVSEKMQLINALPGDGIAILNADNENQQMPEHCAAKTVFYYGMNKLGRGKLGVYASDLKYNEKGLACKLHFVLKPSLDSMNGLHSTVLDLQTKVLGEHQLYQLLAAAVVGIACEITPDKIIKALIKYETSPGRGRLIEGKRQVLIVDDSYNASPEAVKASLSMLKKISSDRRTLAILGNMNELGDEALKYHLEVAKVAAKSTDSVVFVGPMAAAQVKMAVENGMEPENVLGFLNVEQVMDKIDQLIEPKDLVLVKGSQNRVRLERVVKLIMKHPEQAEKLLVRQTGVWRKTS